MSGSRTYTVILEPAEEGGYVVHVPAFPEIVTEGIRRPKRWRWRKTPSSWWLRAGASVVNQFLPMSGSPSCTN